jgi:hypothetical protein
VTTLEHPKGASNALRSARRIAGGNTVGSENSARQFQVSLARLWRGMVFTVLWRAIMRASRSRHLSVVGAAAAVLLAALGLSAWT